MTNVNADTCRDNGGEENAAGRAPPCFNVDPPGTTSQQPSILYDEIEQPSTEPPHARRGARDTVVSSDSIAREQEHFHRLPQSRHCRCLFLLAGFIMVVTIPALVFHYKKTRDDGNSTSTDGPTSHGDDDRGYLHELRFKVLGVDIFRLEAGATQLVATDWMTYTDSPRVSLNETIRLEQRYALLVVYFAMGGQDWEFYGWANDPGVHECEWEHVGCDGMGHVTELHLGTQVDVTGSLVDEIGFLSSLKSLDLSRNRIEGYIPSALFSLTNLVFIDLSLNEFAGSLDSAIGGLANLETLMLYENFLSGTFPDALRKLVKLKVFEIDVNMFEGEAWSFITSWPDIEAFNIFSNSISGTIPTEIGKLTGLGGIDFSFTGTKGTLPTEIGLLTSLYSLSADFSSLEGSIPSEIGNLGVLESLRIRGANMYGTSIPTEIGMCSSLWRLQITLCSLTGTLPSQLGRLTLMESFKAAYNYFAGTIPNELELLSNLDMVDLRGVGNALSGTIPLGLCDIAFSQGLYVTKSVECTCCDNYR